MAKHYCPKCDGPPLDIMDRKKVEMEEKWWLELADSNCQCCSGTTYKLYQCPKCKNVEVF